MKPKSNLYEIISQNVPYAFLNSLVAQSIPEACKIARKKVEDDFSLHEAKNLLPHYQRAMVESSLRKTAQEFGLETLVGKNTNKNTNYTKVISGKLVITASAVQSSDTKVRKAIFRSQLAEAPHKQLALFKDEHEQKAIDGDSYYCIILHPVATWDSERQSDFINLAFPSRDCKSYICNIDLKRFLSVYSGEPPAEEYIKDEAFPTLKDLFQKNKRMAK